MKSSFMCMMIFFPLLVKGQLDSSKSFLLIHPTFIGNVNRRLKDSIPILPANFKKEFVEESISGKKEQQLENNEKNLLASLELQTGVDAGSAVPFWMRSDQYGSVPLSNSSVSVIGTIKKEYKSTNIHPLDWGAGLEIRENVGNTTQFILVEGYAKMRLGIFELKAGRIKETTGLADTTLSSGSFSVSGNALGIPKVQVAVSNYYTLPLLGRLFAFKGNFAHGWMGEVPIQYTYKRVDEANSYFHQFSIYGRFGKEAWKFKLIGGFNHQAVWGNNEKIFPAGEFTLSVLDEYLYVISGRKFEWSKVGNHLGSIDLGFEYNFESVKLTAFRQNLYDIGALVHLANIADGLNGLSLLNTKKTNNKYKWKKLVFEILYTKNQAGEKNNPSLNSGDEDYYNNYLYKEGWSYKGIGLGTPFISTKNSTRNNLPASTSEFFNNNRVLLFHLGFQGSIKKWEMMGKFSYSYNYGSYETSVLGTLPVGGVRPDPIPPPQYGIFGTLRQFSSYLEAKKKIEKNMQIGLVAAWDNGKLLENSGGLIFKISKSF